MTWSFIAVVLDLPQAEGLHVPAGGVGLVPIDDAFQRVGERPARAPAEAGARFGTVELEISGFVRSFGGLRLPRGRAAPARAERLGDPLHGARVLVGGAEVPRLGEFRAALVEPLREREVARERVEHVLPRPD